VLTTGRLKTFGAAFVESIGGRAVIPDSPVEHSSTRLVGRIIRTVGAMG
jgi:hypothetical protein